MAERIFADLDLSFGKHPVTKDVLRKTKDNAVIASLKNLIYTNFYERKFNPTIGSNIQALLFSPIDSITASVMQKEILTMIANFEPRVKVDELRVDADPDNYGFNVVIRFYVLNSLKPVQISLFLNRVR
jgi:phage baseplate assembly protein W